MKAINLNSASCLLAAATVLASACIYADATHRATEQARILNERLAVVEADARRAADELEQLNRFLRKLVQTAEP